ncbi:hypothetical protein DFH08DRAFT_806652 [Mycena albidolilacea]|uniref:Heme haloperoxidase family profile domain-containing protein n=1 Tax=Mycena albidolilacea TaxID=1033008 RepID=A0AAD7ET88_9AGAR|nr:hypothetical protein DFH08DRAFT_806652 [Mycena albidolilacea]
MALVQLQRSKTVKPALSSSYPSGHGDWFEADSGSDAAHPFIAPGLSDQRGPAMNTLANHGYIPRNGIASFEQIVLAMVEAFNLDLTAGAGMVANNMVRDRRK